MSTVKVAYKGDKLFDVTVGSHTFQLDVPAVSGGKDRAATPTELCAASLAACVAAVITIFCENSSMDVGGMTVDMTYDKLERPSRLGNFKLHIRMPQGFEGRKDQILRIAERCPVHETMRGHTEPEIIVE